MSSFWRTLRASWAPLGLQVSQGGARVGLGATFHGSGNPSCGFKSGFWDQFRDKVWQKNSIPPCFSTCFLCFLGAVGGQSRKSGTSASDSHRKKWRAFRLPFLPFWVRFWGQSPSPLLPPFPRRHGGGARPQGSWIYPIDTQEIQGTCM